MCMLGSCVVFLPVFLYVCEWDFLFCLGLLLVLILCLAQLKSSVLGIVVWIQVQYYKMLGW